MKKSVLILLGLTFLGVGGLCWADGKVRATGKATIYKNFTQIARDQALDNAKRLAVEQSVQVFIKSETLVQNFELIYDRIFARYAGYIDSFEIIEDQPQGDQYVITIEAIVKTAFLKEDLESILQSLLMEKANPRLMILFQEQTPNAFIAENAMIEYFLEKGFKLVDSNLIRTQMKISWLEAFEQDKEKVRDLGQRYGAEIIIRGNVLTSSEAFTVEGVEMFANRAAVSVKMIQCDTAELMAAGTQEEKMPGIKDMIREPLEKASKTLAQELIIKLIKWWQTEINQSLSATLIVDGLDSYKEASELQERLPHEARGIQNIHQRLFEQNHLELEIEFKGKTNYLAHDLINIKINGKNIQIINQTSNTLTIKLE